MTTVTIQQNVGGYTGTVDAYVREGRPDKSYQTAAEINVDGADNTNTQIQGLISFMGIFGNGPGQIPLGATITSATLTLSVNDGTSDPVSFYRMAQDWTVIPSLTWNSLGGGIQTNGSEALTTSDLSLPNLASGIHAINVTQSLQAWSGGAANFGWMLSSGGSNGFAFSSSEGGAAPILTVTYEISSDPVPGLVVAQSDGTTVVTEGGAGDSFTIALLSAPVAEVTVAVSTAGPDDIGINPTLFTFTPQNWQVSQAVALSAINDNLVEGTETFDITLTTISADPNYEAQTSTISVTVNDNDVVNPPLSPAVVAIHNAVPYGSGDPSGIAYVPGLDILFIADSESDELPYFSQINLFATRLDGTFIDSFSMRGFTREPTGLAYNPFNGFLYVSDDDADKIFIIDPTNPTVKIGEIDLKPYNITDAEDPVIDPNNGHIYMLDGITKSFIELTATGAMVDTFVFPSAIKDAEGLAYDPVDDVFYVASGANRGTIFQTDHEGTILASFDLLNSYTNPISGSKPKIKGLELAPSSDPTRRSENESLCCGLRR